MPTPLDVLSPIATLAQSTLGTDDMAARLALVEAKFGLLSSQSATDDLTARLALLELKFGQLGSQPVAQPSPAGDTARIDVNVMLHQSRTAMLREMPPGAARLLSAGCAGGWYFDWIDKAYGHVPDHVGIEFYSPVPDTLPGNVTWITNTASDMNAIESSSCDLVFSGQNLEHLWATDVAGFLVEAARVLKPGGHLVVDSPNRAVTRLLNWSHPEHTIELTVPEMRQMLELAGFDLTKEAGLWLCRDPRTGRVLPFDPNTPDVDWSITERLIAAPAHPEHALLWWMEGRRTGVAPDRAGIEALLAEIYREAWPERTRRMAVPAERRTEQRPDGEWIVMAPGETGFAFYGPYMPLRAGHHRVTFDIVPAVGSTGVIAICDLCIGTHGDVLQQCEVTSDMREVVLEVDLPEQQFGGQFRCRSSGADGGGFAVRRVVRLEETLI